MSCLSGFVWRSLVICHHVHVQSQGLWPAAVSWSLAHRKSIILLPFTTCSYVRGEYGIMLVVTPLSSVSENHYLLCDLGQLNNWQNRRNIMVSTYGKSCYLCWCTVPKKLHNKLNMFTVRFLNFIVLIHLCHYSSSNQTYRGYSLYLRLTTKIIKTNTHCGTCCTLLYKSAIYCS